MSKTAAAQDCAYDLLVVGASFAGLVAARTAAMRGLKVAVVEAKSEPGSRVATTGILVKEAAEEIDLPHWLTRRVHGVRLYGPSLRSVDLFAPGYYFLTTDTPNLMCWLADEARRAGADLYLGCRFEGAERTPGGFTVAAPQISARYILGADGARSQVARTFALGRNTRFLVGLEAEYEGLETEARGLLHCFLDSRIAPGYLAWVAPGPKVTQVGLAVTEGRSADLQAFRDKTSGIFPFARAQIVERRAGRIPCGGLVTPWAAPGVMLIGDAAGMVSPATAGGIHLAFRYGRRAAHAVADHLINLGPSPEQVLARDRPSFGVKHALRAVLDLAPPNTLIDLALATPPMRWLASRIYFHRRGKGHMSSAEYHRLRQTALDRFDPACNADDPQPRISAKE